MFIKNIHGYEATTAKAQTLGLIAGETLNYKNKFQQSTRPALGGKTFDIKDRLKAAGAKFDGENKVWTFESWAELDAALDQLARRDA